MGILQKAGQQLRDVWSKLSPGHRAILVLLLVMCVAAIVWVLAWASSPDYKLFAGDLSSEDSASLVGCLKDAKVPFRVTEGGTAVTVPARDMDAARVAAAEKGLPKGQAGGFEIFRTAHIGLTIGAEHINYVSALQNELARTISSFDSVVHARVHLAITEPTVFKSDQRRPTASVMVVTKPNSRLTAGQVAGITFIVARAVPGLAQEDVTVTDGRGNILTGSGQNGPEAMANDQWGYRQKIAQDLSLAAESMLAQVLGPDRCKVQVSADVDFENSHETRREYDPEKRVVIREKIQSEKSTGSSQKVEGKAGTPNLDQGETQKPGTTGTPEESKTENIDTEYRVGESVSETTNRGAKIKRLTVAAFVDIPTKEELEKVFKGEQVKVPQEKEIQDIIKNAVGFVEPRDSLKVVLTSFRPVSEQIMAASVSRMPAWAPMVLQYVAVGLALCIVLFIARYVMKSMEGPRRVLTPEIMAAEGDLAAAAETTRDRLIREQVQKFVQERPEDVSRLLEGWIEGEE